jgi:HD-like signal output (HDOD) protein
MPAAPVVSTPVSREKLLQVARSLPADLNVLAQLGDMLQDVNSELDQIAGLLRRDVALATRIVRISNSPVFGGGGQIASTEEAVNRVGFSEILKLVGTATAARFAERSLDIYGISALAMRDAMLYGALASESLARLAGMDTRVAYTAGLLRPLGLMVIDRACRGQLNPTQRFSVERWANYSTWESRVFGVNNCEVAGMILEEWRFPLDLSAAVRANYLARATDWDRSLPVILNLANGLAQRAKHSFAGEQGWWEITPDKLRAVSLTEEDLEPAIAATEAAFEAATAALAV